MLRKKTNGIATSAQLSTALAGTIGGAVDRRAFLRGSGLAAGGSEAIECWSPIHHPYRGVLSANGFLHRRRIVPLEAHPPSDSSAVMTFGDDPRAAIHVAIGDTDMV